MMQSPEVRRFHRAALMHKEGADILFEECPKSGSSILATEVVYVSGYIAECTLKALLLTRYKPSKHKDVVARVLQEEIGHNLERMKRSLLAKGVPLTKSTNEALQIVRSRWSTRLRYQPAHTSSDVAEEVLAAATELYHWVSGRL